MNRLLFAPESPRPLALMRIGLGIVLLWDAGAHWPFAVELYSTAGVPMPLFPGTRFAPPALPSDATRFLHALLIAALAGVVLGGMTRFHLVLAAVLTAWFSLLDAPGTLAKYTVVAIHLLVLLALAQPGAVWSLDSLFRRKTQFEVPPSWPRRLIQILLCSIYWGAGVTKLQLPGFASGDLLMFSLLDDRWGGGVWGLWLSTQPSWLVIASFATLMCELLFPVLVWVPQLRRWMLFAAAGLHVSVWGGLTVGIFSPLMLVALVAFVEERDLAAMHRLRTWRRSRNSHQFAGRGPQSRRSEHRRKDHANVAPSDASDGFGWPLQLLQRSARFLVALAATVVLAAVLAGVHRRLYPLPEHITLEELTADTVDMMRAEQLPAVEDYFHRFEIGSRLGNAHVFGSRRRFRAGQHLHVLARLVQNHPPLRMEVVMVAPNGSIVARSSQRLERSASHFAVPVRLTSSLPAGTYRLMIRADGYEVVRKSFEVVRSRRRLT